MKAIIVFRIAFFVFGILCFKSNAQDTLTTAAHKPVKSIWDIPHKSLWQKWMWPHRSMVYLITKARPINYDTAYIKFYDKQLVVTLPVSTRFLKFSLTDLKSGNKLVFAPNLQYDLGISISSRWATFIINTGIKLFGDNINTKGKTTYKDYQLNLYGRKITTDIFVQYYNGFYIKNSQSYGNYISNKPYAIRSDVNALNIEVSSYYIVNNKKFSYRNTFGFTEQQKKSAGSILVGVYYSYFSANGNPSLVTPPFKSSFDSSSFIRTGHTQSIGLNLGYIYTLIFLKKCYATASLVQGFGGEQVSYKRDDNSTYSQLVAGTGKLNVRFGLGYDNGRYFIGSMGIFDYFLFNNSLNSTFNYSFGKFMVYVGYRFRTLKAEHKLLHRLKLIDY
jgi:hypothetical protein